MYTSKITLSLIAAVFILLFGCVPAQPATNEPELPNPASVFCEEQGGRPEIRTAADGSQSGVCVFPDGSECDEWAYFRGECQPGVSEASPSPLSAPRYRNDAYGFSFDPPSIWSIEEFPDYLLFRQPGYQMFVGYQWANEEPKPFRTGMPSGEFVDSGSVNLLGQSLPKQILVWEGKNKVVNYGGRIKAGDLILVFYLDAVETDNVRYEDLDIPQEIIAQADHIVGTFALATGETPVLELNP
jgi:putative hemolysin